VKRKIPSPRLESNPRTPIVQPVAQLYTDGELPKVIPWNRVLEKLRIAQLMKQFSVYYGTRIFTAMFI
jgi:hypothetical protein